ncbi:MAG: DUF4268 domain-containing protein [bacterium]|nr:DUF4268 domain-containing protein [bacterium]
MSSTNPGKTLDLELQPYQREHKIGPYFADIVAKDLNTDRYVVIENQLNKTDHDHLGKAITYASVLDATAIVWIATDFSEEHKKALDWLNENLSEEILVFGVQLEVWQIGDSQKAPRFNVISRPAVEIKSSSRRLRNAELTEVAQLQLRFWEELRERLLADGQFLSLKNPRGQYSYNVPIGNAQICINNIATTMFQRVGVRIRLKKRVAQSAMEILSAQKAEIEKEIGEALEWDSDPEYTHKYISLYKTADLFDEKTWPALLDWMADRVVRFRDAFEKRVRGQRFAATDAELMAESE